MKSCTRAYSIKMLKDFLRGEDRRCNKRREYICHRVWEENYWREQSIIEKNVTEYMRDEQRISQYPFTRFELADMQARVDAAWLLVYRAAQAKQDDEAFSHLAAMGKLYAVEAATDVTRRCAQLAGCDGYSRDFPFERLMRDAKITEIYEGTSEVQRMVISSWMGIK